MNYLINRATIDIKAISVNRSSEGVRIVGHLPTKKDINVVVFIKTAKLRQNKIDKNNLYRIEGYLKSHRYMLQETVNLVEINADSVSPLPDDNEGFRNSVELIGTFVEKGDTRILGAKSVASVKFEFLSSKLKGSDVTVSVWNRVIQVFDYVKPGTQFHIECSINGFNIIEGDYRQMQLSTFKATAIGSLPQEKQVVE